MKELAALAPDKPIDDGKLQGPPLADSEGLSFAPGLSDAIFGASASDTSDLTAVQQILDEIGNGRLQEWEQVESRLSGIQAITSVDKVLEVGEISVKAARLFWQVAKQSNEFETVKWGIAIGSLTSIEEKVEDLVVLARHPEFTPYAVIGILRAARLNPESCQHLVQLLPLSSMWGLIRLIHFIVSEETLISDTNVQRAVLIHGMENHGGIPMEVGFTIAQHIRLPHFFKEGETDDRVYAALCGLMETLITDSQPLGGLQDLEEGEEALQGFLTLLSCRPADVLLLRAVRTVEEFLVAGEINWKDAESLLRQAHHLWEDRFSVDIVRQGLIPGQHRWLALDLILREKLSALLPDVRRVFLENPDGTCTSIIAELGGAQDLQFLFEAIPRLVDLEARSRRPMSATNVIGPEHASSWEYSRIVRSLGRLATPEAVVHLKMATKDYDPGIRSAACEGLAALPVEKIDEEIRSLIRARLQDPMAYVVEAAKKAATAAGMSSAS